MNTKGAWHKVIESYGQRGQVVTLTIVLRFDGGYGKPGERFRIRVESACHSEWCFGAADLWTRAGWVEIHRLFPTEMRTKSGAYSMLGTSEVDDVSKVSRELSSEKKASFQRDAANLFSIGAEVVFGGMVSDDLIACLFDVGRDL